MLKFSKVMLLLIVCLILSRSISQSAVPNLISYQSRLTDSLGAPINGTYQIIFSVYDDLTAGTLLWSETHSSVLVDDGTFTVYLGSVTPFDDLVFSDSLTFLEVTFETETLLPRSRLLSVPYALKAGSLENSEIKGPLIITPDDFGSSENAIIVLDSAGNQAMVISVDYSGFGKIDFYDPVDFIPGFNSSSATSNKIASLSKEGLFFFGATVDDTTTQINSDGDISTTGQIDIGENNTSAIGSIVLGYNNEALGDTSTISGGVDNQIYSGGDWSTISGGKNNSTSESYSTVGGGENNDALTAWSTIGGGKDNNGYADYSSIGGGYINTCYGDYSSVGGGFGNRAYGSTSTIAGGHGNYTNGFLSTVGGGGSDSAFAWGSTISGGEYNSAKGLQSTIGGGMDNNVFGFCSTISGGRNNVAEGDYSVASGHNAKAVHNGAMVYFANATPLTADSLNPNSLTGDSLLSGGDNQIILGARGSLYITNTYGTAPYDTTRLINTSSGGYLTSGGVWTNSSDENLKENFQELDDQEILNKISELDIYKWNYINENDEKLHIGPTAQDFHELFGLGNDDKSISTIDPSGVALVAIKALVVKNRKLENDVSELKKLVQEMLKKNK